MPPSMRIICRISAIFRWLKVTTVCPRRIRLAAMSACRSEKARIRSGSQRLDLLDARGEERRDPRLQPRLRRPRRVPGHADDPIAGAEAIERLGRFLGQTDDALRVHRGTCFYLSRPIRIVILRLMMDRRGWGVLALGGLALSLLSGGLLAQRPTAPPPATTTTPAPKANASVACTGRARDGPQDQASVLRRRRRQGQDRQHQRHAAAAHREGDAALRSAQPVRLPGSRLHRSGRIRASRGRGRRRRAHRPSCSGCVVRGEYRRRTEPVRPHWRRIRAGRREGDRSRAGRVGPRDHSRHALGGRRRRSEADGDDEPRNRCVRFARSARGDRQQLQSGVHAEVTSSSPGSRDSTALSMS